MEKASAARLVRRVLEETGVTVRISVLAAMLLCAAGRASAADIPSESYTHPQQLVAIDGPRKLNLFCLGTGSPTVLFESGSGGAGSVWRRVQGEVAAFTRACSYDRAGLGFSDPPGRTVDATDVTDDLQRLVEAAPIRPPIVFVGHSIGGVYGTLFAALHKNEVAGMVLVDPAFAHQFEYFAAHGTQADTSALYAMFRGIGDSRRACRARVAQAAPGQPPDAKEAACLPAADMPEHPDSVLLAAMMKQWMAPGPYAAMVSETENSIPTAEGEGHPVPDDNELDSAPGTLGAIKLVVLSAGRTMDMFPGLTDAQRTQFAVAWKDGHTALAHRSSQGEVVAVPNSGHYIQIEQPAIVVNAVRRVVDAVRAAVVAP